MTEELKEQRCVIEWELSDVSMKMLARDDYTGYYSQPTDIPIAETHPLFAKSKVAKFRATGSVSFDGLDGKTYSFQVDLQPKHTWVMEINDIDQDTVYVDPNIYMDQLDAVTFMDHDSSDHDDADVGIEYAEHNGRELTEAEYALIDRETVDYHRNAQGVAK